MNNNLEKVKRVKIIKRAIAFWFDHNCISDRHQQQMMRLIDGYVDAIHAYRLAELVEKIQGG